MKKLVIIFCLAFTFSVLVKAQRPYYNLDNEIIKGQGICDPHICIFNDTAYLFASHDFAPGQPNFKMVDWYLFSSPDLVNWNKEFVLKPEDTFIGPWDGCWAPDGATRNGKYYFYFSQKQLQTGVAVSNSPKGPYIDELQKPLLPEDLTPTADYDPAIFIDDDPEQTPYIIWGFTVLNQSYYIAKLNEDMMSLAEEPRKIVIHNGWENDASDLHKHNGIYYLNTHGANYATATNVYGPYTYRGKYTEIWSDHGNFFTWNNQTYHASGVRVDWNDLYYRTTKITYTHYRDNGDIVVDDFFATSNYGVGQYDAKWNKIQAEWFFSASDGIEKRENKTDFEMRNITNNAYLYYPNINNCASNSVLELSYSSSNHNGQVVIREGSETGKKLGQAKFKPTGSWDKYAKLSIPLNNKRDKISIAIVVEGKGNDELIRIDAFNLK